jgi:hypothetical protein
MVELEDTSLSRIKCRYKKKQNKNISSEAGEKQGRADPNSRSQIKKNPPRIN